MLSPTTADALAQTHALSARLIRVSERARSDFADVVGKLGLTPQQARAILWLEQPAAMRSLATHLACDASNVTGIADKLEELGLLERISGQDRRVKLLQLTATGAALRADVAARVASGSTVAVKLDSEERHQLATLLDKLLT